MKACSKDSRTLEVVCFIFAVSFIFAAFYYLPHAVDTAAAWILTSFVTFGFAFVTRLERLESANEYAFVRDQTTLKVIQFAVVFFTGWAIVNMVFAVVEKEGVEPESKWMTFIATLMGLKWSMIFMRRLQRIQAEPLVLSRRALLSPIGEIA
jgi:hypothetical protein